MFSEHHILLTGSTGLLGQHLCADLLKSQIPFAVLIRPDRMFSAQQRLDQILDRIEQNSGCRFESPVLLEGDLCAPDLGLSEEANHWLKSRCRSVIHSAASLSFKPAAQHPDNEPIRTNVDGTRNLIGICQRLGISEFHYVSSAYTCGTRTGTILETDGNLGQSFSNDYEFSKLTGERIVREASFRSTTIYRPSIVVDDQPGAPQLGDRTIYYAKSVLDLMRQRFGDLDPSSLLSDIGLLGGEMKNIVPAAWISQILVEIYRRPEFHGQTYHLTHPVGTSMAELMDALLDHDRKNSKTSRSRPATGWGELEETVEQLVTTFKPYFRNDPVFDQMNLNRFLKQNHLPGCGIISRETLKIAGQQPQPKRPANKSTLGAKDGGQVIDCRSDWTQLLKSIPETRYGSRPSQYLEAAKPEATGFEIGINLIGRNGGAWTCHFVEKTTDSSKPFNLCGLESGDSESSVASLHTDVESWNRVLNSEVSIDEIVDSGLGLVETNGMSVSHIIEALSLFSGLSRGGLEPIKSSEVFHSRASGGRR